MRDFMIVLLPLLVLSVCIIAEMAFIIWRDLQKPFAPIKKEEPK